MITLKSFEGLKYNLTTKPEHVIGRYGSSLEIRDDESVSRQHASIKISAKVSKFYVELQDLGSKHNTFVNKGIEKNEPIPKSTPVPLKVHDKVRFGLKLNIWALEEEKFVICAPSLSGQNKTVLTKLLNKVGGTVVSEWSKNCTHLTLDELKMEPQIACALAHGRPIVTFNYWKRLLTVLNSRKELPVPDYIEYIPPVANTCPNLKQFDFSVNSSRRSLFKNLQFLSFDRDQCINVLPMVEAAGGRILDGNSSEIPLELGELAGKNVMVLQTKDNSEKKSMKTCLDLLKKQKKRTISDAEIFLSIAEGSRTRYCNPIYNIEKLFKEGSPVIFTYDATVLVEDSQNLAEADTDIQEVGTGSNFSLTVNDQNEAVSDCDDDFVVQASPPMVEEPITPQTGLKRKLEDTAVGKPLLKCSKLDSFVIRKTIRNDVVNESNSLDATEKISSMKHSKDLFNFHDATTATGKSSKSLFAGVQNRVRQHPSSLIEKNNTGSGSMIPGSLKTPEIEKSEQSRRSTRSLFSRSNVGSSEMESMILFSSPAENASEPTGTRLSNKRKLDPEPDSSTNKRSNLFRSSLAEKKVKGLIRADSDDSMSPSEHSKLSIRKTPKPNVTIPSVVVPTTVNLDQFKDTHTRKLEIKEEPDADISSEIKDMLNKTVLHSVPLIITKNKATTSEPINDSTINFKRFRKSVCSKASKIIPITSLVPYSVKTEMEL